MSFVSKGSIFNVVRKVTVDEETLEKIADLLGIERGRVVSGTIYIDAGPSPSSGTGAAAPPSPARGPRRKRG